MNLLFVILTIVSILLVEAELICLKFKLNKCLSHIMFNNVTQSYLINFVLYFPRNTSDKNNISSISSFEISCYEKIQCRSNCLYLINKEFRLLLYVLYETRAEYQRYECYVYK